MKKEDQGQNIFEEIKDNPFENSRVEVPVYESFKGRQMHGSKTWEATGKERRLIIAGTVGFMAMWLLAAGSFFMPISFPAKFGIFFLAVILAIVSLGGPLFYVAFRHHKKDPVERHYYDVDYSENHLTGEGHDDTEEISKEEFYGAEDVTDFEEP